MSGKRAAHPQRVVHPRRFVSASELGEYAYCRRAWWLRAVKGATTTAQGERFARGTHAHRRHAWLLRWARVLVAAAAVVALAAVVLALLWWRRP